MNRTMSILVILFLLDTLTAGGLWWAHASMQSKKAVENDLRKELVLEDQRAKNLITLKRKLANVESEHTEMSKFLYDSSYESQISLVSQIEHMGVGTSGAIVETTSLDLSADAKPSLRGSISVRGTWEQVYHFLRLLEEFPSNLDIVRFDARGSSSGGVWSGSVSAVLSSLKGAK